LQALLERQQFNDEDQPGGTTFFAPLSPKAAPAGTLTSRRPPACIPVTPSFQPCMTLAVPITNETGARWPRVA